MAGGGGARHHLRCVRLCLPHAFWGDSLGPGRLVCLLKETARYRDILTAIERDLPASVIFIKGDERLPFSKILQEGFDCAKAFFKSSTPLTCAPPPYPPHHPSTARLPLQHAPTMAAAGAESVGNTMPLLLTCAYLFLRLLTRISAPADFGAFTAFKFYNDLGTAASPCPSALPPQPCPCSCGQQLQGELGPFFKSLHTRISRARKSTEPLYLCCMEPVKKDHEDTVGTNIDNIFIDRRCAKIIEGNDLVKNIGLLTPVHPPRL